MALAIFLPGAAFAGDQHGSVDVGDAANQVVHLLHARAGADHAIATAG
jgi:hypothetical protein